MCVDSIKNFRHVERRGDCSLVRGGDVISPVETCCDYVV